MVQEFALIDDGFSITTTIPRAPGLHPAVKLNYRPALHDERQQWLLDNERAIDGTARTNATVAIITKHVQSWDITAGPAKRPASPSDPATVKRLQPNLLDKILNLVLGYTPAQEAADEKNSAT